MPGGRPEQGKQQVHAELAELSTWLRQALADAGFTSINAFVQRHPFDKNQIYGLFKGTRFLSLESTQAVAVALRRKAEEVEPLWWRAKEAMERSALAQRDQVSRRLKSWAELPWPELALHDILEAQSRAVDHLPYRLLGVEAPPLSTVYVRQQARLQAGAKPERPDGHSDQTDDKDRPDASATDSVIEVAEALDRHEHLVVTGEPGAGKSTFGQYLALRLSRIWLRLSSGADAPLREPVIPLRVPARALAGSATWSEALAKATGQTLGMRLVTSPLPAIFERPLQGTRWLIIVDGLDEIVDRTARGDVIQAIATHCRPAGPYRVVVTTRKLPDTEFAPLRARQVGHYSIEPFGREQLETFARQWFTAQDVTNAEESADRFLRQTGDSRLRDLVRNPLLATIAAISYTLEPNRPLPSGRLELYERFFAYLIDEEASGRGTSAELRRLEAGHPTRYPLAKWIHQHRLQLIQHLALTRLESEQSLARVAEEWVSSHTPNDVNRAPGWEEDLQLLLIGSGLFVYEGDGPRFLHHSFAEYLAAEAHAERIDATFPDLDSWIARGLKPADRSFVLFLFVMWSRRPGNNVSLILRRLLARNPERAMLAGRVMAEMPVTPPEDAQLVVDRLVDLAIGNAVLEQSGRVADVAGRASLSRTPVFSIMDVLGALAENPTVAQRLTYLAEHPQLPLLLRIEAATALGRAADPAVALPILKRIVSLAQDDDTVRIARALRDLDPQDPLAETLLVRLAHDPHAHPTSRADAANELANSDSDAAGTISEIVVSNASLDPSALRTAVQAWLRIADDRDLGRIADAVRQQASQSPHHCIEISEAFAEAGLRAEAHELARLALTDPACPSWRLDEAVAAYLSTADNPDPTFVLTALQERRAPEDRASVAQGLAKAGHLSEAASLASEVVLDPESDGYDIRNAVNAWLMTAGDSIRETLSSHLQRRATEPISGPGRILSALAEAGGRDQAVAIAKDLVAAPRIDGLDLEGAVEAWLEITGPTVADELRLILEQRKALGGWECAIVAESCAQHGLVEMATWLAARAIATSTEQPFCIITAAKAWITAAGLASSEDILDAIMNRHLPIGDRAAVADHLAAAGDLRGAQQLWREVLMARDASLEYRMISAIRLLQTGAHQHAIREMTALINLTDESSWQRRSFGPLISALSMLADQG
ncbi:hypothetical protein GCM10009541_49710 [Micromonospora gifhornensis]|uniref:NACHT domain-containing protein n=1 Tax=Micromonospora gifhornensis TaxID=84594 RepID=A0ABQ4IKP8_9ACTN|nr:hypothetical protein [Micromonospora gifhornensis]GIJ18489.1 hypothetical protein Vgi01_51730 [Micromonospora gifhornensis]